MRHYEQLLKAAQSETRLELLATTKTKRQFKSSVYCTARPTKAGKPSLLGIF
jgi:hypothetical protein